MELRHLRYFCSVAEHHSFSRASASLRVAQPSLSRQIRDLETDVGVKLFIRSSAGVRLTDAGEVFFQHATRLLSHLAIAVSAAQEVGKGRGGVFIIGGDWRLPLNVIPDAVKRIRKQYPKVKVELLELPMHEHLMAIRDREIHVGFVPSVYIGMADGIESRRILVSDYVVLLPEAHPLATHKTLRVSDLKDEVWLSIDEKHAPGVKNFYIQLFRLAQISPRFGPMSSSLQGVMTRVSVGDGIALMPAPVVHERHPGTVVVPTDIDRFEIHAIWPREGASPLVKPFIDLLCSTLERETVKTIRDA